MRGHAFKLNRQSPAAAQNGRAQEGASSLHHEPDVQTFVSRGLVFEMGVDSFFGATHQMRPNGERHAHSFRIQAGFLTSEVNEDGMMVGFREVNDLLEAEAKRFAGQFINEIPPFDVIQPTGENIAAVVYRDLDRALEGLEGAPTLHHITLWEKPTSFVRVESRPTQ